MISLFLKFYSIIYGIIFCSKMELMIIAIFIILLWELSKVLLTDINLKFNSYFILLFLVCSYGK
jgi:hypothetical protein